MCKWLSYRPAVVFAQSIEVMRYVEDEDVDGAAPTSGAPTTSEWSTMLLLPYVRFILEVRRYIWMTSERCPLFKNGIYNA